MKITGSFIKKYFETKNDFPDEIFGFNIDTRKILNGEIFVALKTANRDGHDFLELARERGAAGALVSRQITKSPLPQIIVPDTLKALQSLAQAWREHSTGTVVGVTGSVGKTSTKDLLKSIFSAHAPTHATYSNLNNTIGVPLTILGADSAEHLVVEAGMSIPGELDCSAKMIRPNIAVITNVKPAHLEGLGSMENIAHEKSAMARNVCQGGIAVFPAELLNYKNFQNLQCERIAVAFNPADAELAQTQKNSANFHTVPVEIFERGNGFEITFPTHGNAKFFLPEASRGLAENSALAVLAASHAGVPAEKIAAVLAAWKPSANRGEMRTLADGRKFFVDCYNASPASILDSAAAFVRKTAGASQRLFVLGGVNELGAESEKLHRFVGENLPLSSGTDTLATFGGNAKFYAEGAIAKGFPRERSLVFEDIEDLKKYVAEFRGSVMVKGSRGFALERVLPESTN